ncbi:MAG TPA: hypothetical protein VLH61_10675 [Bacteroidales bacterium]|nr:hypothetical protein [Bacteroidales bacterium]
MKEDLTIIPLIGFGDLKFGLTKNEVKSRFGEPQEIETIEGDEDFSEVEVWSYWDKGHSLYFEKELDDRLTNFETDHENVTLFGKKLFGMKEKQIISLMEENGFSDFEAEYEEEWEERRVSFFDAQMDFIFDEDVLVQVTWAVGINNDDQIQWPK